MLSLFKNFRRLGPDPLQKAERRCCAGGREAWMPSEERWARDGPCTPAPERGWNEGSLAKRDPDAGARPFGSFGRGRPSGNCQKGLAQQGETSISDHAVTGSGTNRPSTHASPRAPPKQVISAQFPPKTTPISARWRSSTPLCHRTAISRPYRPLQFRDGPGNQRSGDYS